MDSLLEEIRNSLNTLNVAILGVTQDERTFTEMYGWNQVSLNIFDIAAIPQSLISKIEEADINHLNDLLKERLKLVPNKLNFLQVHTVPQLNGANGVSAVPAFVSTMVGIENLLTPILGWQVLQDNKAMPAQLASRLRSIQSQINAIVPDKNVLESQIKLITNATQAAESLPTDLESLHEARMTVSKISRDSAELFGKIDTYFQNAGINTRFISEKKLEADKLVENCEEAYRMTTTKGLASAFDVRATKLSNSMWGWVFILFCSLLAGAFIGYRRVDMLSSVIKESNPQWGVIWMHIALSIVSVSAPIWLAWLATKQISKRFQLSEDYAFKASVAKAYEGYRKEAARLDVAFEARLFSSALTRLEEAPLRLIDNESYGSPWHELIASAPFQKAISNIPELKSAFVDIFKSKGTKFEKVLKKEIKPEGTI